MFKIEIFLFLLLFFILVIIFTSSKILEKISSVKDEKRKKIRNLDNTRINVVQKNLGYVLKFPRTLRLELSNYIYNHLTNSDLLDEKSILEMILLKFEIGDNFYKISSTDNDFLEIMEKLNKEQLRNGVINYIYDLIAIISKLFHYKANEKLIVREFVSVLYSEGITLGMTRTTLEYNIAEIFDFLKTHNSNLKLSRLTKKLLYDDDKHKECSRCGKIKENREFNKTQGRLRYICKECSNISKSINLFKKKVKIFEILSGGQEKAKCVECKTSIENLPSLEIHHIKKSEKNVSWRDIQNQNFNKILKTLQEEEITILCTNCHSKKQAKNYHNYNKLILNDFFLEASEDVIQKIVYNFLKRSHLVYSVSIKRQVMKWIKKRIIIEKYFNGKCVACEVDFVHNNLPALQFHHTKTKEKDELVSWQKISHLSIDEIIQIINNEECVCLCGNCHQLIHASNFLSNLQEIFIDYEDKIISKSERNYEKANKNITNFKFDPNLEIPIFNSKNWLTKSQLKILLSLKKKQLSINQLCKLLGFKRTFCYDKVKLLEARQFILKNTNRINREFKFSITKEGLEILNYYKIYKNYLSELLYFEFDE